MAKEWVIFDLETTGLSPQQDEIIQIAAVRMIDGEIQSEDTFFSYANPGIPIPRWIREYTGVTERDVQHAPSPGAVLTDFSRYVAGATLVAHNGHRFDMRFLAATCAKNHLITRIVPYHDSIRLSWILWGQTSCRHGLDAVLQRLNITKEGIRRHDARGDVTLLARAVERMWLQIYTWGSRQAVPLYHGVLPEINAGV
jgi:DNA polymerase III subunit epsilon